MFSVRETVDKIRSAFVNSKGRSYGYGWTKLRNEYIEEHTYCEICGYKSKKNDVHHIEPRHISPEKILDPDNLMTLCRKYKCHLRFGHFGNYSKYFNPNIRSMVGTGLLMVETEVQVKQ